MHSKSATLWNPSEGEIVTFLVSVVNEAEKRARKRVLSREQLQECAKAVREHPAGELFAHAGGVSVNYPWKAETTRLDVLWWWRRNKLTIHATARRDLAPKGGWARRRPMVNIQTGRNTSIWCKLFPERFSNSTGRHSVIVRNDRPAHSKCRNNLVVETQNVIFYSKASAEFKYRPAQYGTSNPQGALVMDMGIPVSRQGLAIKTKKAGMGQKEVRSASQD